MPKQILYIGNALSAKGNTTTVIEDLSRHLKSEGYTVYTASAKKNKFIRFIDMIQAFYKFKNKVSLVIIDTYSTQNFYYATTIAKLCRRYKKPYIPILHGGNLPARLDRNPKKSARYFENSKFNVAPSNYLIEAFKNRGYKAPIYIPNSIELKKYPFLSREHISAKLLWVRSFSEIYNPMLAVQIVEQLLTKKIPVKLTMVGPEKDGSLAKCKAYAVTHKLPITFSGLLSKEEWITVSAKHDIFINTTNFDNMPVSIIEAMALGMPIISTDVGGLNYLLEDNINGILVPPSNPQVFVDNITKLIEQPQLVKFLSTNARNYSEQFDWKQVRNLWLLILEK